MKPRSLWAYGVVARGDELKPEKPDISGGKDFLWVRTATLSALASYVPDTEYNEDTLAKQQNNPQWIIDKVQACVSVVAFISSRRVIIPFRFGSVFSTEQSLKEKLDRHSHVFHELLQRLAGTEEWGVKVFASVASQAQQMVEGTLDQAAKSGMSPGRRYMLKKQLLVSALSDAQRDLKEKADLIHRSLVTMTSAHQPGRPAIEPPNADKSICLMKSSYLVPNSNLSQFLAQIEDLTGRYENLHIQVSGPWAPYSFCHMDV